MPGPVWKFSETPQPVPAESCVLAKSKLQGQKFERPKFTLCRVDQFRVGARDNF